LNRLQSGKFTPVTEKFIRLNSKTILARLISLGYLQGVQLGWNLYHSPVFMSPGTHTIPSGHNLYQQTDGIPLGLAPWNPYRPATRMAVGISAGRSGETLFHKGEPIPPGLAPWNESGAAEHLPFRSFPIRLAQNLYHRGDVIPPGIYIFSKGSSRAPSAHNEGGAFFF
jgi:hypothetical protein